MDIDALLTEYQQHMTRAAEIMTALLREAVYAPDIGTLSVAEAAAEMRVSPRTIHRWAEQGRIAKVGERISYESLKCIAKRRQRLAVR